jgi:hypothetical protein
MGTREIGLADAVEALRRELEDALLKGSNERVQFGLQSIELTLEVAVTWTADAKLGWSILGVGGSRESVGTQTLKLVLDPKLVGSDGPTSFRISGDHDPEDAIGGRAPAPGE